MVISQITREMREYLRDYLTARVTQVGYDTAVAEMQEAVDTVRIFGSRPVEHAGLHFVAQPPPVVPRRR